MCTTAAPPSAAASRVANVDLPAPPWPSTATSRTPPGRARIVSASDQNDSTRRSLRSSIWAGSTRSIPARIDPPMPGRMHADEVDTDPPLVSRLLADQFPQWAHLPIERFESSGTDNAIYRLGEDMAVRLPRIPGGTAPSTGSSLVAEAGTAAPRRNIPAARERLARASLSVALVGAPVAGRRERERRADGRFRRPGAGSGRLRGRAAADRCRGRADRRPGRVARRAACPSGRRYQGGDRPAQRRRRHPRRHRRLGASGGPRRGSAPASGSTAICCRATCWSTAAAG